MTQYSGKIIRKTPVVPSQTSASGVWTTADAAAAVKNNTWPVAGVPNPISRSLRFRSSASAYLSRTPATAGNRRTFTISAWVKRGSVTETAAGAQAGSLFGAGNTGNVAGFKFAFSDIVQGTNACVVSSQETVHNVSNQFVWYGTEKYRDPSAWYHIVVAFDTPQATASNRFKVWVNGQQLSAGTYTVALSQNQDLSWNNNVPQFLGASTTNVSPWLTYFDGLLAEVYAIDGQALTPSSFGTTDSLSGAWVPMPYTGTYGTNGFYLNFKDTTSTTTLGYDYSGNNNHFTPTNISLTAGSTYDSMVDVPTLWMPYNTAGDVGATVRGNYATFNPLHIYPGGSILTISQGNLYASGSSVADRYALATMTIPSTGKIYFEATVGTLTSGACYAGAVSAANPAAAQGSVYFNTGQVFVNGSQATAGAATFTSGNVIGVAVDYAAGTVAFYKNNTLSYTATGVTNPELPIVYAGGICDWYVNFGQRPFTYTPPTGFKTLNTFNLPDPTIKQGAAFMAATLYTGNDTGQTITNTVNNVSMQPDFLWIKVRSTTYGHVLADSVRGVSAYLASESSAVEGTNSELTSFNGNGFTLGATGSKARNVLGATYVAWQWNAGGATVSNNSGSIASQVRANPAAGFSIVTYTGTGANATVGHGLGAAPKMVIVKRRNAIASWIVWQTSFAGTDYIVLESTAAKATLAAMWNSTTPTSSVFSLGTNANTNNSADTYVAYCWAEVAGYSKFGSYTGNGSTDGPFVFTNFRPRWVMIKRTDANENWQMYDTSRNTSNVVGEYLLANSSGAGATITVLDFLSNGFKIRVDGTNPGVNTSGGTYIYMAFAENPFKYSNAR